MSNSIPRLLRVPKIQMIFLLGLIYLSTLTKYPITQTLPILILALTFSSLSDLLFTYIRRRTFFIPYAAIVTALIITLIIDPKAAWYQIATISTFAMVIKNFLRISQRHIFNPAASGLFIGGIIFNQYVSWWGVSFQTIRSFSPLNLLLFLILLFPLFVSAIRLRRYVNILSFLIFFPLLTQLINLNLSLPNLINSFLEPGILFFALVMLPEPMTTPVNPKRQMLFGFGVAILVTLLSLPLLNNFLLENRLLTDPLVLALLMTNLLFFRFR
ncbi:MAG: RnfABCDGE type electron transport complex subunit D [Candidatus Daviesbacteria bacterium]|nr:RnfABCDGE type electron transport complex subunit D [Candidatus Daviesbacteria bacterium]